MRLKRLVAFGLAAAFSTLLGVFLVNTKLPEGNSIAVAVPKANQSVCKINLNNKTLYLDLCPNQVSFVTLKLNYTNSSALKKKYKHILVLFDPNGTGNYSVAVLNFLLSFPKYFAIPVCVSYDPSCKLYLIKINDTTAIFAPTKKNNDYEITFEADLSKVLVVYINQSDKTLISQKDNHTIVIEGDSSTIRPAVDKFIFWWYGVVS